jgi:glycyl-tRNA synthetase
VTVDCQSLDDGTVTVRDRDTMTQHRVKTDELTRSVAAKLR